MMELNKINKNIKGICFDVGGTLIKFENNGSLLSKVSELVGIDKQQVKEISSKHFIVNSNKEQQINEFCKEIKFEHPDQILDIFNKHVTIPTVFNETNHVLKVLKNKGYSLGVISNVYPWSAVQLKDVNLAEFFTDCCVYSYEYGVTKPSKEIFEIAESKLKLKPEELVFVGDSINSDVQGAKNANWLSVYLNRNNHVVSKGEADISIKNLEELLAIF
jgi:HAD superfamily hydrolase (TIGR01509 family)